MKLKDPGTIIEPIAEKRIFKGKEYWVVQVNYAEEVGKDRWYFYLNTETYALEIYQFFHGIFYKSYEQIKIIFLIKY